MAYSYQQNVYEGASYGYVQYNISPDIGTPISAGTTVTITGKAYLKNSASKSLQLCIYRTGAYKYAFVNLNIPKATATDFTLQFQMWQLDANWGSGRVFQVPFDFTFWTAANCEGDGNTTVAVDAQKLSYLTYRISPAARVVLFDRYSASGSGYVKNDEGTLVMGSLAISLATGRSVSDITVASVSITGDDGSSKSLTLSQEVLTAALSSEGYTESAPGLFASMSFGKVLCKAPDASRSGVKCIITDAEKVSVLLFVVVAHECFAATIDLDKPFELAALLGEKPSRLDRARPTGAEGESLDPVLAKTRDESFDLFVPNHLADVDQLVSAILRVFVKVVEIGVILPLGVNGFTPSLVGVAGCLHSGLVVSVLCLVVVPDVQLLLRILSGEIVLHGGCLLAFVVYMIALICTYCKITVG